MKKKKKEEKKYYCGECIHCKEVWEPRRLLSLEGRPTLGRCPFWTASRSVLLSQLACGHFKGRNGETPSVGINEEEYVLYQEEE